MTKCDLLEKCGFFQKHKDSADLVSVLIPKFRPMRIVFQYCEIMGYTQ